MYGDHDTRLSPVAVHVNRWGDRLGVIATVLAYPERHPEQVTVLVGWPGMPKHVATIRKDRIVIE